MDRSPPEHSGSRYVCPSGSHFFLYTGASASHFQLLAPYNSDPRRWASMTWTDYYSGKRYAIATTGHSSSGVIRAKSYADAFGDYRNHPEVAASSLYASTTLDAAPPDCESASFLMDLSSRKRQRVCNAFRLSSNAGLTTG